ncbi:MAG: NADH-quinone oxidoreductase subunit C [Thermoanaerobaculia bacterium]
MAEETNPTQAEKKAAPVSRTTDEILADQVVAAAVQPLREAILEATEFAGEITLVVERRRVREVAASFKSAGYTYLVDLTGVDYSAYPGHSGDLRFGVVYHLYSFEKNVRIRLKVRVADGVKVPSVTSVWKTANWCERETYDMFGILFEGHPRLERILMWDEFNGHPLRKDFPIRGIDTGARIYPEVFPAGGGPKAGSTGKEPDDVNLWEDEWTSFGVSPVAQPAPPPKKKALPEAKPATPKPAAEKPAPAPAVAAPAAAAPAPAPAAAAPPAEPPLAPAAPEAAPAAAPEAPAAVTGASAPEAPWHDETLSIEERLALAKGKGVKAEAFAAMAQTDCGACGWDCEGYGEALATGETDDITLCVPGAPETEDALKKIMAEAGKSRS